MSKESKLMAIKKLYELMPYLTESDFIEGDEKNFTNVKHNLHWWKTALRKLKNCTRLSEAIELCKMMLNFINDIKGVIKYSIIDYLEIVIKE